MYLLFIKITYKIIITEMFRDTPKIIIEDASSPSASYVIYIKMEDLLEKLKLLHYDNEFLSEFKIKAINR